MTNGNKYVIVIIILISYIYTCYANESKEWSSNAIKYYEIDKKIEKCSDCNVIKLINERNLYEQNIKNSDFDENEILEFIKSGDFNKKISAIITILVKSYYNKKTVDHVINIANFEKNNFIKFYIYSYLSKYNIYDFSPHANSIINIIKKEKNDGLFYILVPIVIRYEKDDPCGIINLYLSKSSNENKKNICGYIISKHPSLVKNIKCNNEEGFGDSL